MRTEINGIDNGALIRQLTTDSLVERFHFVARHEPFCDAALIADDDDAKPALVEQRDSVGHAGQKLNLFPAGDVLPLGRLPVNDSVAIEKCCLIHEMPLAPLLQC